MELQTCRYGPILPVPEDNLLRRRKFRIGTNSFRDFERGSTEKLRVPRRANHCDVLIEAFLTNCCASQACGNGNYRQKCMIYCLVWLSTFPLKRPR